MPHDDPRVRRGAHRSGRDASAALVPSLLAVLAVSALITALYVWQGEAPQSDVGTAAQRTPVSASASPTATATASPSSTPTTAPTSAPATTTSSAAEDTAVPEIGVVVLNQTGRSGLAASVADRLRGHGWTVIGVGNFHGVVPATTVYYPVGQEDAAMAAANSLPTPARIRPRFGNLSTSRLTVVVTTNYPA